MNKVKHWVIWGNNIAIGIAGFSALVALGSFLGMIITPKGNVDYAFPTAAFIVLLSGAVVLACQRWLHKHFPDEHRKMLGLR